MEPRPPRTKMLWSFHYIHYKGQNGERKAMSAWKLCPLVGLAPITTESSLPQGAKAGCGIWEAQLGGEPYPCLSSSICTPQGRQELGKKPSISWAWAERESVGAPWGRRRPEESKEKKAEGLGHLPRARSQKITWGVVNALKNQTHPTPKQPRDGHCVGCGPPQAPDAKYSETVETSQASATERSPQRKNTALKCTPKMQPLLVWRNTEKAVTVLFNLTATF